MLLYLLSTVETPKEKLDLTIIYYKYRKMIKYEAFKILNDEELAEEATQDTLVNLATHLNQYRGKTAQTERAYICTVARRAALMLLRKENKYRKHSVTLTERDLSFQMDFLGKINQQDILKKLCELPPDKRQILELWAFHGQSRRDIAKTLGVSYNAVQKELQVARKLLYQLLKEADLI